MASNTAMKKFKGLKDHKKAQKEKAIAKRAVAAADQSKSKNGQRLVTKMEPMGPKITTYETSVQQSAAAPAEVISEKNVVDIGTVEAREEMSTRKSSPWGTSLDEYTHTTSAAVHEKDLCSPFEDNSANMVPVIIVDAPSNTCIANDTAIPQHDGSQEHASTTHHASTMETFDVYAHRAAVETDLFENMESPKERFARINHIASATVECHHVNDQEDDFLPAEPSIDLYSTSERAVDEYGWECVAVRDDALAGDAMATTHILSADQLFSMVSETGVSRVGSSESKNFSSLQMVEEQQKITSGDAQSMCAELNTSSVVATQASSITVCPSIAGVDVAAAELDCSPAVDMPSDAGDAQTRAARARACITAGLNLGCHEELADAQTFIDPAIISCTVTKASQVIPTRSTVQPCVKALVFTCPDETVEDHASIDPAVISCEIKEKKDSEENVHVTSASPSHSPELEAALFVGSEKIMTTLGIGGRAPTPESASGVLRSRTTSHSSSAYAQGISTGATGGFNTPVTHHSVSPPIANMDFAQKNHDGFDFNSNAPAWFSNNHQDFAFHGNASAWGPQDKHHSAFHGNAPEFGNASAWTPENNQNFAFNENTPACGPNPADFLNAPPYGHQHPGFGPPYFLSKGMIQHLSPPPIPCYPEYAPQIQHQFMPEHMMQLPFQGQGPCYPKYAQ
jgi:hypothetical protein